MACEGILELANGTGVTIYGPPSMWFTVWRDDNGQIRFASATVDGPSPLPDGITPVSIPSQVDHVARASDAIPPADVRPATPDDVRAATPPTGADLVDSAKPVKNAEDADIAEPVGDADTADGATKPRETVDGDDKKKQPAKSYSPEDFTGDNYVYRKNGDLVLSYRPAVSVPSIPTW